MIKITVPKNFKSIKEGLYVELPDFTIISGINGAGKSHLLNAIEQNVAEVYDTNNTRVISKRYINSIMLAPNDAYQVGRDAQVGEVNNIYYAVKGFIGLRANNPSLTLENHLIHNKTQYKIIEKILKESEKSIDDLDMEDISEFLPLSYGVVTDIFYQNFSTIFKRYYDKYEDNIYHQYLKEVKGKNKKYLTDKQFQNKFGSPPWQFVNRIFEEANLSYTINDPIETDRDIPFMFKLINKSNGAIVNFSDLSSGEKVLMSLTLSIYNAKLEVPFPDLLLLDEPDAPLHPSMAKQLLRVINEVFVKEKGVKVIMTTHSPSTIAMAPDDSLFVMQKDEPRIVKKSKEQIMKLLTNGIPSFSIYADDRRQVFVESDTDAAFYTKIYGKLKSVIQSDKSLYFISSGVTKGNTGNCDQVKEIVNVLSKNGNQTVYGIVDWDKKNNGNDKIYVLGLNQRYSIENYIFDPILLANFLLREKMLDNAYFGLSEDQKHFAFPSFEPALLQKIIDKVIFDISNLIKPESSNKTVVYYLGKISLEIPTWYLHYQGHQLEDTIKKVYPKLGKIINLKAQIVDKVIDDLPEFLSVDLLTLLQALHN